MPSGRVQTQVFVITQQAQQELCFLPNETTPRPTRRFSLLKKIKSPSLNWQLDLRIAFLSQTSWLLFENTVEVMSLEFQAKLPSTAHKALRTSEAHCLLGHSQFPLPSSCSSHTHVSTKQRRQELSNPHHPHLASSCLRDLPRLAGSDPVLWTPPTSSISFPNHAVHQLSRFIQACFLEFLTETTSTMFPWRQVRVNSSWCFQGISRVPSACWASSK